MNEPWENLKIHDMRIGERLYTFPSFDEGCKAIAIHCRFLGNQDCLEALMKERGIQFSKGEQA